MDMISQEKDQIRPAEYLASERASDAEYLLVSQYHCRVEKFIRQEDGTWIYSQYQEMEQVVEIEAIGCGLPLSEIYRKVSFDPHQPDPHPNSCFCKWRFTYKSPSCAS